LVRVLRFSNSFFDWSRSLYSSV